MSGDENGVATVRATRLTLAEAIRSAPRSGVLRRRRGEMALADHILAELPEHVEPDPLNPEPDSSIIDAANATIAELRGRCDELFAANRLLREENVRKAVTITDLRQGIDQAASQRLAIDEALSTVPGLSQSHGTDQAADVQELAARCAGYENAISWNTSCTACARTLDSSIAEHERADRAEQKIAAAVTALRPLAKLKGPTVAERTRVVAQVIGALAADGAGEAAGGEH